MNFKHCPVLLLNINRRTMNIMKYNSHSIWKHCKIFTCCNVSLWLFNTFAHIMIWFFSICQELSTNIFHLQIVSFLSSFSVLLLLSIQTIFLLLIFTSLSFSVLFLDKGPKKSRICGRCKDLSENDDFDKRNYINLCWQWRLLCI